MYTFAIFKIWISYFSMYLKTKKLIFEHLNWLRLDGSLAKLSLLLPIIQGSTHLVSYTIFHFVEKSVLWVELLVGKWLHFCRWDREDKEVMCLFGNLEPIFSHHSPLRADLTKKIRASKKTTTAWKGTPYRSKINLVWNPRKVSIYDKFFRPGYLSRTKKFHTL